MPTEHLNSVLRSSEGHTHMQRHDPTMSARNHTTHMATAQVAQTTVGDDVTTTFESLPAELRNRIYHLSGCLEYYEEPDHGDWPPWRSSARHTIRGDYIADIHTAVHGCQAGKDCSFAVWDDFRDWKAAACLVNGSAHVDATTQGIRTCAENTYRRGHGHGPPRRMSPICYQMTGAQPALTKVSKKVRGDTLPIFYGNHPFVFRLFSRDASDQDRIVRWLDMIGPTAASSLRNIYIFYARKQQIKYIKNQLLPELRARGVRTAPGELGVVQLTRIIYPYNANDYSVLEATKKLRDAPADKAG